jgi:hypothetical protein
MKKESSIKLSEEPDESDPDIASLLGRMQQHLLALERKIDLLIGQSQERPHGGKASPDRPFRKRPFSKPFRSFDRPKRQGKGEYRHGPKERDSDQGHFNERRPHEKSRGSNPRKKPFFFKRKDRE